MLSLPPPREREAIVNLFAAYQTVKCGSDGARRDRARFRASPLDGMRVTRNKLRDPPADLERFCEDSPRASELTYLLVGAIMEKLCRLCHGDMRATCYIRMHMRLKCSRKKKEPRLK